MPQERLQKIIAAAGIASRRNSATAAITCPGVQKPHCAASCAMKAACTGCSAPSVARPSTVSTVAPSQPIVRVRQE